MTAPRVAVAEVAEINPKLPADALPNHCDLVSFVPMAAVSEDTLSIEESSDRPYEEVAKGYTPFVRGDILVAKITPCFENGKMAHTANLAHDVGFGSTEFHVLRPRDLLDGRYLFHLLREPYVRRAGVLKMRGAAGQRRVPADFLGTLRIPVPSLAEQKRIAAILDAVDGLRATRRESLAQLGTLGTSLFIEMFGDPVANPKQWGVRSLEECSLSIVDGPFGSNLKTSDYVDSGVPVLQGKNITGNEFRWFDVRYITAEKAESLMRSEVRLGDHLVIKIGSIGYSAVLDDLDGHEFAIIPANMARVRRDPTVVDEAYLHAFLTSARTTFALKGLASKTAQPALSLKKIRAVQVPVPPLDRQCHFATIAESIEKQKDLMRAHLAELDTLFASLLQRAFNGEL